MMFDPGNEFIRRQNVPLHGCIPCVRCGRHCSICYECPEEIRAGNLTEEQRAKLKAWWEAETRCPHAQFITWLAKDCFLCLCGAVERLVDRIRHDDLEQKLRDAREQERKKIFERPTSTLFGVSMAYIYSLVSQAKESGGFNWQQVIQRASEHAVERRDAQYQEVLFGGKEGHLCTPERARGAMDQAEIRGRSEAFEAVVSFLREAIGKTGPEGREGK